MYPNIFIHKISCLQGLYYSIMQDGRMLSKYISTHWIVSSFTQARFLFDFVILLIGIDPLMMSGPDISTLIVQLLNIKSAYFIISSALSLHSLFSPSFKQMSPVVSVGEFSFLFQTNKILLFKITSDMAF